MPDFYDYADRIEPGVKVTLERTVYYNSKTDNIAPYIDKNPTELEQKIGSSEYRERELYQRAKAILDEWAEQAGETATLKMASKYQQTKTREHTGNQWTETKNYTTERTISNLTYKFTEWLHENARHVNGVKVITGYDVGWTFCAQSPAAQYPEAIDSQFHKTYKDLESAEKYLAGRFKKYSKYFTELQPKIIYGYHSGFMVGGVLLPGYEVEMEES